MKCRSCNTSMVLDRCESSQHATTCWHQCPLCGQVRLTSDPVSVVRGLSTVDAQADDDGVYLSELESAHADAALL